MMVFKNVFDFKIKIFTKYRKVMIECSIYNNNT